MSRNYELVRFLERFDEWHELEAPSDEAQRRVRCDRIATLSWPV